MEEVPLRSISSWWCDPYPFPERLVEMAEQIPQGTRFFIRPQWANSLKETARPDCLFPSIKIHLESYVPRGSKLIQDQRVLNQANY